MQKPPGLGGMAVGRPGEVFTPLSTFLSMFLPTFLSISRESGVLSDTGDLVPTFSDCMVLSKIQTWSQLLYP